MREKAEFTGAEVRRARLIRSGTGADSAVTALTRRQGGGARSGAEEPGPGAVPRSRAEEPGRGGAGCGKAA